MNFESTNNQLLELYESKYPELTKLLSAANENIEHREEKATNPLLLQIDEKYANADFKVMIFGKETNNWEKEFSGKKIDPTHEDGTLYEVYNDFFLNRDYIKHGGQFLNFIEQLKQNLDDKVGMVWNNVLKIGKYGTGEPCTSLIEIQYDHFNVINDEIKILQPDLLIFLSCHGYDKYIERSLGALNKSPIEGFEKHQLCKFKLANNIPAIRTYHPGYLYRIGYDRYYEVIMAEIKKGRE